MKESTFGKREAKPVTDIKYPSSCAASTRTESRSDPPKPEKLTKYRVYYVKEEVIMANSYESFPSAFDSLRLKITFSIDGKSSCIRDLVSKVEKLSS